jgi:RHS repeat-associated protein
MENATPSADTLPQLFKRTYAYDKTGQLTRIQDSGKGEKNYRYDPVGRLTESLSPLGAETFAFDPAGNLLDTKHDEIPREASGLALELERHTTTRLPDNLVREYQGARYRYDARGNLTEKITPEGTTRLKWNSLNQLIEVDSNGIVTRFTYDPLGRRVTKHSTPSIAHHFDAGRQYHQREEARLSKEKQLGWTLYGWEGDRLAWESRDEESIHYLYEPGSFIPLAQGVQDRPIQLHREPDWTGKEYRFQDDPLWQRHPEAKPFRQLLFYHCDQIGTPMEMTDERGEIVWSAEYKAWGEARITVKEGYKNSIRFQGQYYDHETGLHYNRHRYYDPKIGRFISKDPIGLMGGFNFHVYVSNPTQWVDPLGLEGSPPNMDDVMCKNAGLPAWCPSKEDLTACSYYEQMGEKTGCFYYKTTAPFMCKNSKYFPNFAGLDDEDFNCIRRCLVREDAKVHNSKPEDKRNGCLSNQEIDDYHEACFKECNVSTLRYPGVKPLNPQKEN